MILLDLLEFVLACIVFFCLAKVLQARGVARNVYFFAGGVILGFFQQFYISQAL